MIRKKILTSAVGVLLLFAPFTAAITANAAVDSASDAKAAVCDGLGAASGGNGCEDPDGSSSLSGTVAAAINLISLVVAVIAVFMVIVGGLISSTILNLFILPVLYGTFSRQECPQPSQ